MTAKGRLPEFSFRAGLSFSVGSERILRETRQWHTSASGMRRAFGGSIHPGASPFFALRGGGLQLWEGGIRMLLCIQWKGHLPAA